MNPSPWLVTRRSVVNSRARRLAATLAAAWVGLTGTSIGRAESGRAVSPGAPSTAGLATTNLALRRESYAVRFVDSLPPASAANDGNTTTEFKTTDKTVDGYWEVDLGSTFALDEVRVIAATGFTARLAHATVRLYDDAHNSVFSQHLRGTTATFVVDSPDPVPARFVRVGFENKERSDPAGGIEWYLGLKEVQVFGRPRSEVGILGFTTPQTSLEPGRSATLQWRTEGLSAVRVQAAGMTPLDLPATSGSGALAVTPPITTEYLIVGTNRHFSEHRFLTVEVGGRPLPIQISEIVADNRLSLEDGRGDAPDWIELHNPNARPVNLEGYGLSDDPARPMKWTFPAVNLPAHGYIVVFASGRNAPIDAGGSLHASFQLDASGESVVLTSPDGSTTLDTLHAYPPQREDLAFGTRPSGGDRVFLEPTPGGPNLAPFYAGWLAPLQFSHGPGFVTNDFSLALTHPDPQAEILYSLNGRDPTSTYAGPIAISTTTCLRASVRRPGFKSPRVQTHTFLFLEKVVAASNMNRAITQDARYRDRVRRGLMDLPSISIAVPQLPDDYIEREASVEIFWPEGSAPLQVNCGFYRFGGAWTTFPKKNYRLKFRSEYGAPRLEAPLFRGFDRGVLVEREFDELDLGGGSHDMVDRGFYLASRFAEDTLLDMGSLNPHGRFVNLYINGTYWGQYHARERLNDAFLADYLGGRRDQYVNVRGNDNVGSSFILGTPEPPQRAPWDRVLALGGSYHAVKPFLDVPHLIDFVLMWGFGDAETEFRAAGPAEAGTGFKFWLGDADGYLRTSALNKDPSGNAGPGNLFGRLAAEADPEFLTLLADRVQRHCFGQGALTPARNLARLDERMLEITNSLVAECARWGFRTPANWEAAAQAIRTGLFPNRTRNLVAALRSRGLYPSIDAPSLNHPGGVVTQGFAAAFTAAAGTIYYTLDGSDPRLPGGDVSPSAVALASGSVPLIARGATWRYWDRGSRPGVNWMDPTYPDTSWSMGRAELGYGDGGETTPLSFGPDPQNKYRTAYFRHAFVVPAASADERVELSVELVRDDGAVVYLDGREILRDNVAAGPVQFDTLATSAVGGDDESRAYRHSVVATNLSAGTHVLAVEVHQASANSSDLSFDLALSALTTTAPPSLVLNRDTLLRARVRQGTTWSALLETRFILSQPVPFTGADIVLSEIHYNPDGSDDFEFIELTNRGTNVVDLGGARIEGGIEFLCPSGFRLDPGQFAVIVEDAAAFATRYQSPDSPWYYPGLTVAGEWSGRLEDAGERIALLTSNRLEVLAVDFRPDGAWPRRADGRGSSLELQVLEDLPSEPSHLPAWVANPANWRPSLLYHGSPGRLDRAQDWVVLNEVVADRAGAPGWIELRNTGSTDADLFGLHVGDSYQRPMIHSFTDGTRIEPGGFLTLSSGQLGFTINERGADLLLVRAAGTNVLRFVDGLELPEIEPGVSMGPFHRSDGKTDVSALRSETRGTSNALPRIGPVVISEIHYRPPIGHAEYVELAAVSTQDVLLADPARPTNTWRLAGAVDFVFPVGTTVAACSRIIVGSTNPAALRSQYGIDHDVAVFGPWTGSLNNAGESLRLERPGTPRADGTLPWFRVDRVRYEPLSPWPVSMPSEATLLERMPLEAFGNDPVHWRLASVSANPGPFSVNRPPALDAPSSLETREGETLLLHAQAVDPDGPWQTVHTRAENLPPGADWDPDTGRLSWTPGETDGPGTHIVRLIASDTAVCVGSSVTQEVAIAVHEVNQPPVLAPISALKVPAGMDPQLVLSATDPDWPLQTLSFSATGLPVGLVLDPLAGRIAGTTSLLGTHAITVWVSDGQEPPLSSQSTMVLTVTPPFALQLGTPPDSSPRTFRFNGLANQRYEIETSDRLHPPQWRRLLVVNALDDGPVAFTDSEPNTALERYYRVLWHREPSPIAK